ncbi:MAG TPA: energy transducer TonB [Chthoniobacterales bacterium]|nr:energy transducer TonB [Chthoniobacterales bacterium]
MRTIISGVVAILIFSALAPLTRAVPPLNRGVPPQPQVFTGPDIGKVFSRLLLPEFPYEARRNSWSGRGTFRAHVSAEGKVTRVEVVKSTGHGALDDAVLRAVRHWRAHPGRKMEVDFPMAFIAPPRPRPGLM